MKKYRIILLLQTILMIVAFLFGYVHYVGGKREAERASYNEEMARKNAMRMEELAKQLSDCCDQN